jgi:hypothetical protein
LAIFCEMVASQLVWAFMPITAAFMILPLIYLSLKPAMARLNTRTLARG